MKLCSLLILVIFAASPVALAAKSYDGYKVPQYSFYDLNPQSSTSLAS